MSEQSMRKILFGLQAVLLSVAMQQAAATPIVNNSESTYPVQGNNIDDILKQVDKAGPEADGKRFSAVTEARVSWTAQNKIENDKCAFTDVQVTDTNSYVFPVWANYQSATPALQKTWDNDIQILKQHEYKHGDNSVQAAYAVERMLQNLAPMDNCEELKAKADAETDAIVQRYKAIDVAYDNTTEHGAKPAAASNS